MKKIISSIIATLVISVVAGMVLGLIFLIMSFSIQYGLGLAGVKVPLMSIFWIIGPLSILTRFSITSSSGRN